MTNLTAKANQVKMRSNDGESIPTGRKAPMNAGALDRHTKFSNTEAFESGNGNGPVNGKISGMHSWSPGENLDDPGFDASGGCFYKFGIPYGEAAMFNQLPPGPDISDQAYLLYNEMPLRTYSGGVTYPGDTPWPVRDIKE
jgi:hypothetical protein